MRISNLHKFRPYWTLIGKQLIRKASREFFGRSLLPDGQDEMATYPHTQWRQVTLDYIEQQNLLTHAQMYSGRLYAAEGLTNFSKKPELTILLPTLFKQNFDSRNGFTFSRRFFLSMAVAFSLT